MSIERFPDYGRLDEYDALVEVLLARLSAGLPLPTFWMLERDEQRVAIAVCAATKMSPEVWRQLSLPERLPWLQATLDSSSQAQSIEQAAEPQIDDVWSAAKSPSEWRKELVISATTWRRYTKDGPLVVHRINRKKVRIRLDTLRALQGPK